MSIPIYALVFLSLLVLTIFMIFFVRGVNKKKEEEEVKDVITLLSDSNQAGYSIRFFGYEELLINKLNIQRQYVKIFCYVTRTLLVLAVAIAYTVFGVLGIAIALAAVVLYLMDNKKKAEIEKSGVTRISDTVAFMDYFSPVIASGQSASQAMIGYIQKLEDDNPVKDLLIEYWNAKRNEDYTYVTPAKIKDVVSIYETALYNEEIGAEDYLSVIEEAKADLFQKSVYYSDYNSKVSEVLKPVEGAYYVGVPAIIFLLLGTVGEFWYTIPGWITAAVIVLLFFCFKYLVNRLAIKTIGEILG